MITLTSGGIVVLVTKVEEEKLRLLGRTRSKTELIKFKMLAEHPGQAVKCKVEFNKSMKFKREILAYIFVKVVGKDIEVQEIT